MRCSQRSGLWRRTLDALGIALRRGILGKSAQGYMSQFTGNDQYWERVIAAQAGWPQGQGRAADSNGTNDSKSVRTERGRDL